MKKKLILYSGIIKYGLKTKLIYRGSTFLSSMGSLVYFLIQILIWKALLSSGERFDTSFEQMVTYLIITQIVGNIVRSTSGQEIANRIMDGSISIDFVRPVHLKGYLFCNDLGNNLFKTIVIIFPTCFLLIWGYGLYLPHNYVQVILFVIMIFIGSCMVFYYRYIMGLFSFWMIRNPFVEWHFQNVETLFAGSIIPIWLYPDGFAKITKFMPFRYFTYESIAIFIGKTPLNEAGRILLYQIVWLVILYSIERLLWTKAYHKVVVQGG